ncbi:MAG: terminase gpA endonuclease subunit [Rubrimonas sp.]
MARIDKGFPDYADAGGVLPPFNDAWQCLRAALDAIAPPVRVPVSSTATRRAVNVGAYWKQWDNDAAPYMREPADATASRRFKMAVFVGPARSLKTQGLVINPIVHAILAAPRLVHVVHVTQTTAQRFSEEDLGPTIANSPELAARLRLDNVLTKTFAGGARVTIGWPVAAHARGRTIPLVILTDAEAMPENVDGEGDPVALFAKRTQTLGSAGMTVVESSPAKPILDADFKPETPHQAPPAKGIASLFNEGTRGRWYWRCPECAEPFRPEWEQLRYDASLPAGEAGEGAVMTCPHCGGWTEARHKAELNRRGFWLHETRGAELTELGGDVRPGGVASWWLPGPAAALTTYAELVQRYEAARRKFEETGDETALQTAVNVDLGRSYLSQAKRRAEGLSVPALKALATADPWGVCPAGTAFVLVAVDVQSGRFAVQVEAWRRGMARTMVARFDLTQPPPAAPRAGERALDPGRYLEDWGVLDALFAMSWPVAGGSHRLRAAAIVCDSAGEPGVTDRAFAYWRAARRAHGERFRLVKGWGGFNRQRAHERAPETAHQKKGRARRRVARDVLVINAGVDRLKDELLASLLRVDDGPGAYRIPRAAPDDVLAEFCAEARDNDGWSKKPGQKRNEALDLAAYSLALAVTIGAEKIDWSRPPAWALGGPGNVWSAPGDAGPERPQAPPPEQATPSHERSPAETAAQAAIKAQLAAHRRRVR